MLILQFKKLKYFNNLKVLFIIPKNTEIPGRWAELTKNSNLHSKGWKIKLTMKHSRSYEKIYRFIFMSLKNAISFVFQSTKLNANICRKRIVDTLQLRFRFLNIR